MSRAAWVLLAVVVVLAVAVAVIFTSQGPAPGLITGTQLEKLQSGGARVVDVRTEAEFQGQHIPGAENVPLGSLAAAAAGWDRAEDVVLYCATGSRSAEGAAQLQSMGFERVYDLRGGIMAWDGTVEGGPAVAGQGSQPSTSGLPVAYEFYTDW